MVLLKPASVLAHCKTAALAWPFHDWDVKIPAKLKAQIQKASDGIKDGSIKIDLPTGG